MKYIILLMVPVIAFAFGTGTVLKIDEVENNTASNILLNPLVGVDIAYFTGDKALISDADGLLQESATAASE